MAKPKAFLFRDPIYGVNIFAAFCATKHRAKAISHLTAETKAFLSERGWLEAEGADGRVAVHQPWATCFIWINTERQPALQRRAIIHESLHVTLWTMQYIGMDLHEASHEAFTYHHGWLVGELLKLGRVK